MDEYIAKLNQLMSAAHEKSVAYTNLVTVAGYAGFFALWQLAKEYLDRKQVIWSALLMLVSIVVFVLFEIYKSYYTSRRWLELSRILSNPENHNSINQLSSEIESYNLEGQRTDVRFGTTWQAVFIVTVMSGLCAYGILLYAFIRALLAN